MARSKKKKRGPRNSDGSFKMLLEELKFVGNELVAMSELSTEAGKSEAVMLSALYLSEFIRRFKSKDMTHERCRELSMTAMKMKKRQAAPAELEALLKKGVENVSMVVEDETRHLSRQPLPNTGEAPPKVEDGAGPEEPGVPEPAVEDKVSPGSSGLSGGKPNDLRTREQEVGSSAGGNPTSSGLTILPAEDEPMVCDMRRGNERTGRGGEPSTVPGPLASGGAKTMTKEWEKANQNPSRQIVLPDGTVKEVESLELPDSLQEIQSNVGSGGVAHVPRDSKMFVCPNCKMEMPDYARACGACNWQKKG